MKQAMVVVGLVLVLGAGQAEASQLSDGLRKTWSYLFSPVNCVSEAGVKLVALTSEFIRCVLNNANPGNLVP